MPTQIKEQSTVQEVSDPSPELMLIQPPLQGSYDVNGDGFLSKDELSTALDETASQYPLPPGYSISLDDTKRRNMDSHPDSVRFEIGTEHTILASAFECAWGQTFLDAEQRRDTVTMAQSLSYLRTIVLNVPTYTYVVDTWAAYLDEAELGDSANLQSLLSVNCSSDIFSSLPEGIVPVWEAIGP